MQKYDLWARCYVTFPYSNDKYNDNAYDVVDVNNTNTNNNSLFDTNTNFTNTNNNKSLFDNMALFM